LSLPRFFVIPATIVIPAKAGTHTFNRFSPHFPQSLTLPARFFHNFSLFFKLFNTLKHEIPCEAMPAEAGTQPTTEYNVRFLSNNLPTAYNP
jgi:hypothetical protein